MQIVPLVGDGDTVAARFRCSATHHGDWLGHAPTGRRFESIDEVSFFTFRDDLIATAWGLEDTSERFHQLGLRPWAGNAPTAGAVVPAQEIHALREVRWGRPRWGRNRSTRPA